MSRANVTRFGAQLERAPRRVGEPAKEGHDRARRVTAEGRFDREVVPFVDFRMDQTARVSTREKMATLQPVAPAYPKITAAGLRPDDEWRCRVGIWRQHPAGLQCACKERSCNH